MAAQTTAPSSYRPAGTLDASTALLPYSGPWNRRLAAHLLRRAGFGGAPADVDRLAALPVGAAVESLVRFPDTSRLAGGPDLVTPPAPRQRRQMRAMLGDNPTPEQLAQVRKQLGQVRRQNLIALQSWWLGRMIASPAPLQEKMTLFWHGHFTSAVNQKGISGQEMLMQNQLFREYALGNVRDLTLHVSQDPAMLRYLDNNVNVKAHPNENYARELMEL
ncbi:MAG: hypothetical protein QOI11_2903, partial [Candidatus Eremiobacteraeota bacterium]|nr:hypothetical protein [Candidatus Eremiobacteraeota bacterium]